MFSSKEKGTFSNLLGDRGQSQPEKHVPISPFPSSHFFNLPLEHYRSSSNKPCLSSPLLFKTFCRPIGSLKKAAAAAIYSFCLVNKKGKIKGGGVPLPPTNRTDLVILFLF